MTGRPGSAAGGRAASGRRGVTSEPVDDAAGVATTLGSLTLQPVTVVAETDGLRSVAAALVRARVTCALLAEPPLRVVTEGDLGRAWADGHRGHDHVGTIASSHPYWAPATTSVGAAAAIMVDLGVRHLVVLNDEGAPVGVVAMSDLFAVLVHAHQPAALYASFATVLLRTGVTP